MRKKKRLCSSETDVPVSFKITFEREMNICDNGSIYILAIVNFILDFSPVLSDI